MKAEKVIFFDDREEECADLLVRIGIRKNVAMVLVYLANIEEATSR
ncbi:MAG: ArsR family transcriptional regulator, partial [Methanoregula sp.]|nr:ArsR family transcriptional regulator [Methanoregula sp.]